MLGSQSGGHIDLPCTNGPLQQRGLPVSHLFHRSHQSAGFRVALLAVFNDSPSVESSGCAHAVIVEALRKGFVMHVRVAESMAAEPSARAGLA
jgi:hypothetical protein